MILRKYHELILERLQQFSAVGLLGSRQVGKTTLALEISKTLPSLYLDLEDYRDLAKLSDPMPYLEENADKLIILDEIQRAPELFSALRALIDKSRRSGKKFGQFLILGSASLDLLQQSSESLAGRINYIEISPLSIDEIPPKNSEKELWLKGGYPDSFLTENEEVSLLWRHSFIKTYLERDIPMLGPRIASETLRRLWIMLAHSQGGLLNASQLAANLGVSGQTITRYIDLLTDLFLVRKLSPWSSNIKKRLVKSPKIYVRDSGITHALLDIVNYDHLITHPVLGASWEGFVIDNVLASLPSNAQAFYYRTARGSEVDLVIKIPNQATFAVEIKCSSFPKLKPGFYEACKDIKPSHCFVIYQGKERFPIKENIFAISLVDFINEISNLK